MNTDDIPPSIAKQVLCRYNADGVCMYGDSCYFSHDRSTSKYHNVCNFFLKGYCRYGEKCRFDHVKASKLMLEIKSCSAIEEEQTVTNFRDQKVEHERLQSNNIPIPDDSRLAPSCSRPGAHSSSRATLLDYDSNTNCISSPSNSNQLTVLDTRWAEAPVFHPSVPYTPSQASNFSSYSDAARTHLVDPLVATGYSLVDPATANFNLAYQNVPFQFYYEQTSQPITGCHPVEPLQKIDQLCQLFLSGGLCHLGVSCPYVHGEQCPICCYYVLHPTDKEQRKKHEMDCFLAEKEHIEHSFKLSCSESKVCGICMDVVFDKPSGERMFGILSDCTHVFCLSCLREWRCQKNFDKEVKRSCPECRVVSHLVIPSKFWVEEKAEKDELLKNYKMTLSTKDCKYFDKGNGVCPFGIHCFYKHANSKGELVKKEKPRYQTNSSGETRLMGATRLIDALTERESRSDVDLIGNLFELSVEDFFVAAAILGWSVDSDVDDDDEDADDEEPHWRSDSDASAE